MWPFDTIAPKQTVTVESVKTGIDDLQKEVDKLREAISSIEQKPLTEVVMQKGGARRSKKGRCTMKNKRNKRTK